MVVGQLTRYWLGSERGLKMFQKNPRKLSDSEPRKQPSIYTKNFLFPVNFCFSLFSSHSRAESEGRKVFLSQYWRKAEMGRGREIREFFPNILFESEPPFPQSFSCIPFFIISIIISFNHEDFSFKQSWVKSFSFFVTKREKILLGRKERERQTLELWRYFYEYYHERIRM